MNPSPTVRRRKLGMELRKLRDQRGLSSEEVASRLGWQRSKLSRIETGRSGVRAPDVGAILDVYGVDDPERREALEALAREGKRRGWWQTYRDVLSTQYADYIGMEAGAATLRNFEQMVVPGLLQTSDYARAVTRADQPTSTQEVIDALVDVRMARQAVLTREKPLELWAIMDEAVLMRSMATASKSHPWTRHGGRAVTALPRATASKSPPSRGR